MNKNTPASPVLSASGVIEAKKVGGALNILFDLDRLNKKHKEEASEDRHIAASRKLIDSINELLAKKNG
jgi:hypothetical protein